MHILYTISFKPFPQSKTNLHFLDPFYQFVDGFVEFGAFLPLLYDLVVSVHDRRMVASAETLADLRQGSVRQLAAEIHGYLTGQSQSLRALLGKKIAGGDLEIGSGHILDQF